MNRETTLWAPRSLRDFAQTTPSYVANGSLQMASEQQANFSQTSAPCLSARPKCGRPLLEDAALTMRQLLLINYDALQHLLRRLYYPRSHMQAHVAESAPLSHQQRTADALHNHDVRMIGAPVVTTQRHPQLAMAAAATPSLRGRMCELARHKRQGARPNTSNRSARAAAWTNGCFGKHWCFELRHPSRWNALRNARGGGRNAASTPRFTLRAFATASGDDHATPRGDARMPRAAWRTDDTVGAL